MEASLGSAFEIAIYRAGDRNVWDALVAQARNGHFQFLRDYMEYHADRFEDLSLLIWRGSRIVALMAGHRSGTAYYSHQGLSFGGLIQHADFSVNWVIPVMTKIRIWLQQQGFKTWIYKTLPTLYHHQPAMSDHWALFVLGATWHYRNTSVTIDLSNSFNMHKNRKRALSAVGKRELEYRESRDASLFHPILTDLLLRKFGRSPVHTQAEMQRLMDTFPENIRLHLALRQETVFAGVLMYNYAGVAHAQYIAATPDGEQAEALTGLFHHLIQSIYHQERYFDFGICNEENGAVLNEGLARFKEGFGAGITIFDAYRLEI